MDYIKSVQLIEKSNFKNHIMNNLTRIVRTAGINGGLIVGLVTSVLVLGNTHFYFETKNQIRQVERDENLTAACRYAKKKKDYFDYLITLDGKLGKIEETAYYGMRKASEDYLKQNYCARELEL